MIGFHFRRDNNNNNNNNNRNIMKNHNRLFKFYSRLPN